MTEEDVRREGESPRGRRWLVKGWLLGTKFDLDIDCGLIFPDLPILLLGTH